MGDVDWLQVLKWVFVVLAAGFIGQFGKRLADYLLARRRRRHQAQAPAMPAAREDASVPADPLAPPDYDPKTVKKLAKAAAKVRKKAASKS